MIYDLIDAIKQADIFTLVSILFTVFILFFVCMPSHEFAHAWVADKLGDKTARYQGRLTLNPFKHLDLFGFIMMMLIGIGYAKPVPVNMFNFKNKKRDMALVSLAGPMMNLFCGIIAIFLSVLLFNSAHILAYRGTPSILLMRVVAILYYAFILVAQICVSLAIFNLIPIPPFDGSRILGYFLPDKIYYKIMQYEQIIYIVVLVALWAGFLSGPNSTVTDAVFNFFYNMFSTLLGGF